MYRWILLFTLAFSVTCRAAIPLEAALQFFDDPVSNSGGMGDFALIPGATTGAGNDDGLAASNSTPVDITTAKLGVASVSRGGGLPTFQDNLGNTWTAAFSSPVSGSWPTNQMFYCINPTTSAAWVGVEPDGGSWSAQFFTCTGTPVLNGHVQAGGHLATTFQPGSLTPPSGTNLFVSGFGGINGAFDIDSSFTSPESPQCETFFNGTDLWSQISWKNSATAENPTWGNTATTSGTASMLMFGVSGGGGGWALVSSTVKGSADAAGVTTDAINTTGASKIVIVQHSFNSFATPTDSVGGNTWVLDVVTNNGVGDFTSIFSCTAPHTGAAQTFSVTGVNDYPVLVVYAFSGGTGTLDKTSKEANNLATSIQGGSITPSANGEAIVSGFCFHTAPGAASVDSGFNTPLQINSAALSVNAAGSYLIQSTAAPLNQTWTIGTSTSLTTATATYQQ